MMVMGFFRSRVIYICIVYVLVLNIIVNEIINLEWNGREYGCVNIFDNFLKMD